MKVFRDNKCYVSFKELARYEMPDYLELDKDKYEDDDYAIITDPKSIEYVRSRMDIVYYDSVRSLSERELNKKIKKIEIKLDHLVTRYLDTPKKSRKELFEDEIFREDFNKYSNIYFDLIHYRNNREMMDYKMDIITEEKGFAKGRKRK